VVGLAVIVAVVVVMAGRGHASGRPETTSGAAASATTRTATIATTADLAPSAALNGYPAAVRRRFVAQCLTSTNQARAAQFCRCVFEDLSKVVPYAQFAHDEQTRTIPAAFAGVESRCAAAATPPSPS
jgi:hypothetical protein